MWIEGTPIWMLSIIAFLKDQVLLDNKEEAHKFKKRALSSKIKCCIRKNSLSLVFNVLVEKKLIVSLAKLTKEFVATIQEG